MSREKENSSRSLLAVSPGQLAEPDALGASAPERVEFSVEHKQNVLKLILVISVLLLAWSWFTELDEIAEAPGQMIPTEEVQPIRAGFDSKVSSIFVRAGDRVKKGSLLLTLDTKTFLAELENSLYELKISQRQLERQEHAFKVLSNFQKNPAVLPTDLSSVTAVAKAIGDQYSAQQQLKRARLDMKSTAPANIKELPEFSALKLQHQNINEQRQLKEKAMAERRKHFALEEEKLKNKVKTFERKLELQKTAVAQRQFSLECAQKQLTAYEKVFASGASSKTECLDARIRVEDRQKDLTIAESRVREVQGGLEEAKHELMQLESRNSMELSQMDAGINEIAASEAKINKSMRIAGRNLIDAETAYRVAERATHSTYVSEEREISNLKKQIEQLKASIKIKQHDLDKGELRSPLDGKVALLHIQGAGEVVQHGQDLLTIVPDQEKLLACLHVPNDQIAFLAKGQLVKLQFPAYPYQQFGTIFARVKLIDQFPSQQKEYATTYKVLLEPQQDWIKCRGRKIPLRQGLEVQAQLILRKRRLLVSILAPLLKLQYVHFKA